MTKYTFNGSRATAAIVLVLATVIGSAHSALAAANEAPTQPRAIPEKSLAAQLVHEALQAELAGQKDRRDELVKQALKAAPDYAPAHWLNGEVKFEGQWHTLADAQRIAAGDPRLKDYRRVRDESKSDVQGQLALAKWCQVNGLTEEARAHFANVFELKPGQPDAVKALGLKQINGQWLTQEQIADQALHANEREQAAKDWKPVLAGWRKSIEHGSPTERDAALKQLRSLTDTNAIPALETTCSRAGNTLGLEVIAILDKLPDQAATESLVRHAVLGKTEKIRNAAADALKKRPKFNYIPLLLSELKAPVKAEMEVTSDGRNLKYRNIVSQEGEDRDQAKVMEGRLRLTTPNPNYSFFMDNALARAMLQAEQDEQAAAKANKKAVFLNQRIYAALTRITAEELYPEPRSWWDWWHKYRELHEAKRPMYEVSDQYDYRVPYRLWYSNRYAYGMIPNLPSTTPPPPTLVPDSAYYQDGKRYVKMSDGTVQQRDYSCFAKGTKVWTLSGRMPIDEIKAGDRVLAQDPQTGELAYKPVLRLTRRPLSPVERVRLNSEIVEARKGHPFWIPGRGWAMTKELAVGNQILSMGGAAVIDKIEESAPAETYNLVVSDFNTYFVGDSGLLVHDVTRPRPTSTILPGLVQTATDLADKTSPAK